MSLIDNLRKFINIIDKLRDIGLEKHIQLPRIVVLGSQSSGKSSLLESIVGIDFLPRGDGLVTRRPLEMRLVNVSADQAPTPYAIFEEIKDTKFSDFDVVRQKIIELTDKIAGTNKNIVNIPIVVTIYSSTGPDLTLVDLPGITRIPLHNSGQPENIEEITKNMALHYAKEPRTIILAVVPANADLSTSDALKMAKEIDPQGTRTLGVLTKIDIMDKGTNAKRILNNQEIHLNLGYVGVKLRSQQDIIDKTPIKKSLEDEKNYFAQNSIYSSLPSGVLGIENLTQKLTQILFTHIRTHLPNIVKEVNLKIKDVENSLDEMGPSLPVTDNEKFQLVFGMIQEFSTAFQNSISGKYQGNIRSQEIPEGSKFREMFTRVYEDLSKEKTSEIYSDYDIKKAILLHEGDQLPGFQSMDAFYYLLQPQLQKLCDPAFDCLEYVHQSIEKLTIRLLQKQCQRFPALQSDLEEKILKLLYDRKEKTREIIENVLDYEMGYLFTNDDKDFNTFLITQDQNVDNKKQLNLELRNKIDQYFRIALRGLKDLIPKIVGNFYIRWFQNSMQMEVTQFLNQNQEWKQLVQEPEYLVEERRSKQNSLEVLKNAVKVIKKDPDLWSYSFQAQIQEEIKPQQIQNSIQSQQQTKSQPQLVENKNIQNPIRPQQATQNQNISQNQNTNFNYPQTQNQPVIQNKMPLVQNQNVKQVQNNIYSQKSQQSVDNSLFGNISTSSQQSQQNQQSQQQNNFVQNQKKTTDLFDFDSFTDKAVDSTFQNDNFQKGLRNTAQQGAYKFVDKNIPIKGQDGKNPLGDFAAQIADKAVQNQQVQDNMKNQIKTQIKEQKKEKGFFGMF